MGARSTTMTILLVALLIGGCAPAAKPPNAPTKGIARADAATTLIHQGGFILDVRTPEEFRTGHLVGATNIPHDQLMERLREIPGDHSTPIVIYCRSGRSSELARELLTEVGYTKAVNAGGLTDILKKNPTLKIEQ